MLNTRALIEGEFGGVVSLHEFLSAHVENAPPLDTVRKWHRRDSFPSEWLATCLVLLEDREGRPISLKPYMSGVVGQWDNSQTKHAPIGEPPSIFD